MIVRRLWATHLFKGGPTKWHYEGWFLFGFIPLYINRF